MSKNVVCYAIEEIPAAQGDITTKLVPGIGTIHICYFDSIQQTWMPNIQYEDAHNLSSSPIAPNVPLQAKKVKDGPYIIDFESPILKK